MNSRKELEDTSRAKLFLYWSIYFDLARSSFFTILVMIVVLTIVQTLFLRMPLVFTNNILYTSFYACSDHWRYIHFVTLTPLPPPSSLSLSLSLSNAHSYFLFTLSCPLFKSFSSSTVSIYHMSTYSFALPRLPFSRVRGQCRGRARNRET